MKKEIFYLIGIALLLSSCVKQSMVKMTNLAAAPAQTYAIEEITGVNLLYPTDPDTTKFGYVNGRLSFVNSISYYNGQPSSINTTFTYNDSGQLKSTAIKVARPIYPDLSLDIISSAITYSGNHISTIIFFHRFIAWSDTMMLKYEDDRLIEIYNPNLTKITFTYDSNGNNIKQTDQLYTGGHGWPEPIITTNSSFDDKVNFASTFPMWVYFKCYTKQVFTEVPPTFRGIENLRSIMTTTPGKNNPVNSNCDQGMPLVYKYRYDTNGYPSTITYPGKYVNTYHFVALPYVP